MKTVTTIHELIKESDEIYNYQGMGTFLIYNHFLKKNQEFAINIHNNSVTVFRIAKPDLMTGETNVVIITELGIIFYTLNYFQITYKKIFQEAVQLCFEFLIFEKYSLNTITLSDFCNILNLKKTKLQKKVRVIQFENNN